MEALVRPKYPGHPQQLLRCCNPKNHGFKVVYYDHLKKVFEMVLKKRFVAPFLLEDPYN